MSPISQRVAALAAVALIATTAGCSSDEGGSDGALKVAAFASLNGVPTFAADKAGIFAEHDIEADISVAKTSTEMVPQLLGGKADIALLDAATSLVAAAQGVDIVFVAAGTEGGIPAGQEEFSFANVWVDADSSVKGLADLAGKTVGVPQIKSQPWVDLRASVDAAGGDSSTIEFTEVPDPISALKSGQVDAITTSEPVGSIEKAKGELRTLGPVNSGGGNVAYLWVTTRAFAEKNPEVVAGFADAIRAGNTLVNEDRDLLVATSADVLGADAAVLKNAAYPAYATDPLTAADIDAAVSYLEPYDMFEKGAPDADRLVVE